VLTLLDSVTWNGLPGPVRDAIQQHTGPVTWTTQGGEGWSTNLRLILQAATGKVFIKGTGPGDGEILAHQRRRLALGADLASHLTAISPPLLFRVEAEGWNITGWPALPGRPWANQAPQSPDVPKIAGLLTKLAHMPAPDIVTGTARDDWGHWADNPDALNGDSLCHSDPKAANFVVDDDQIWLVDWGWALRGPAWLTPALTVLSLIEAGWHPGDAEQALMNIPAWRDAPRPAVQAFADANARMWERAAEKAPSHRLRRLKRDISRVWADYRETGWLI
jgi:hypothetical protein